MKAQTFRGKPQSQGFHPLNLKEKKKKGDGGLGGWYAHTRTKEKTYKEDKLYRC